MHISQNDKIPLISGFFLETILIILGHSMIFEFNEFMSIKRADDPALSLIQDLT